MHLNVLRHRFLAMLTVPVVATAVTLACLSSSPAHASSVTAQPSAVPTKPSIAAVNRLFGSLGLGPVNSPALSFATAQTQPVNGAKESAKFTLFDTGRSLLITGTGSNMSSTNTYVSLIYPDGRCSTTEAQSGTTIDGAWQSHGASSEHLVVAYTGAAYQAVRGHIGSISIREVTSVSAGAPFTAQLTARACAPVNGLT